MYSIDEFAKKIKSKYPAYQNIDNKVLVERILEKYPVYKSQIDTSQSIMGDIFNQPKKVGTGDVIKEIPGAAKDIGKGILKGVASTVEGISLLGQKGLNATMGKIVGQQPISRLPKSLTKPSNLGQKIGKGAEQIAEFAAPGGLIGKAGKAIGATSKIGKIASKIGLEAGGIGAVSSAQTGSLKKGIKSGVVGGLTMGGLSGAGKAINKVVSKIPETAWGAILKRTPTSAFKNPNLEKQIAQEGVVGITKKSISTKIGKEIQNIELAITDLLKDKKGEVTTESLIDSLAGLRKAYSSIPGEDNAVKAIDEIGLNVVSKGETITVQAANELKRNIYGLIEKSYGKGLLEVPAKTEAQKLIARSLKTEIEKIIPDVKDLNAKMAIFIQTKKAIDQTIARETGKGIAGLRIGLFDILTGIGGGLYGLLPGGTSGLVGVAGAILGKKAVESPATLTTLSKGTQKMIDYFSTLSPTQKIMFYSALRGLVGESIK